MDTSAIPVSITKDSTQIVASDSLGNDSLVLDSVSIDSIVKKDAYVESDIEDEINYESNDSMIVDVVNQKVFIFGKAHVDYGKITLEADYIEIDWKKSLLTAKPTLDSNGNEVGIPLFKEGSDQYQAHEIKYNFDTEEGIIKRIVTEQGGGYVHGETVKKTAEDDLYIKNAKYTTCNMEHPHFYINSSKMKMVPDKVVVSGPFNVVVEDVPTPLGFAFGIFPIPKEKSSGLIIPQPGFTSNRGFSLQGGGYYWAPNDYMRVSLTGDYFTNGSWRVELNNEYIYRYHYQGKLKLGLTEIYEGFTKPERTGKGLFEGRDYSFVWNHKQLSKKKGRFSADIKMQSQNYGRANLINPNARLENVFYGNISYSRSLGTTPFSVAVNLRNQSQKGLSTFTLPDVNINMQRQQPFKSYRGFGENYVKNLSFTYNSNFKYTFDNIYDPVYGKTGSLSGGSGIIPVVGESSYGDTLGFNFDQIPLVFENGKFGYKHESIIQNPFKLNLGNANITTTPFLNISQLIYDRRLQYSFNYDSLKLEVNELKGFYDQLKYSYGLRLATTIYAQTYKLGSRFPVFKNLIQPGIGYTYTPNFSERDYGYLQDVQTDQYGNHSEMYIYNNFVNSSKPADRAQSVLSYYMNGNVKMDYYKKTDTSDVKKSFPIIKSYSIASSYDFNKDSLNLSPVRVTVNTAIFNNKLNITYNSNHSFYRVDSIIDRTGKEVNQLYFRDWLNPLRTTTASLNLGTSLKAKRTKKTKVEIDSTNLQQMAELAYIEAHPEEFLDFSVPWTVRLNYIMNWRKVPFATEDDLKQTLSLSGDVSISPKMKIDGAINYDIVNKGYSSIQIGIVRDLHCWDWSIDWTVYPNSGHAIMFVLKAKSAMLQDVLKVRKRVNPLTY